MMMMMTTVSSKALDSIVPGGIVADSCFSHMVSMTTIHAGSSRDISVSDVTWTTMLTTVDLTCFDAAIGCNALSYSLSVDARPR